jgi:PAS domain S-box-containing protein
MMPKKSRIANTATAADIYPDRTTLLNILDHMYDELYVINQKGECIYVNRACLKHYGIAPEEIIGQNVWESSDKGYFSPPVGPIVLKSKKIATFEQESNTGRKLLVTATPVFGDRGELVMVVENLRDVTYLEQVKNDLRSTKQLLHRYQRELEELRKEDLRLDFVAHSKVMKDILSLVLLVAKVDSTVLITGATGAGKGVLAKFIHSKSNRRSDPFITINCAAIPEQLLESELFGYERGAFTGAHPKGKLGLLEVTGDGTMLLDEVADIPLQLQAKLLQVLQDKQYFPIGSNKLKPVNCRILAATNRNLGKLVEQGLFRSDLYYRLKTIEIDIPPLSERPDDLIPLIQFYLSKFDRQYGSEHYFTPEALDTLTNYNWPGNVREVEHLVERLVVTVPQSAITLEHIPLALRSSDARRPLWADDRDVALDSALEILERELILRARRRWGSSYQVAKALHISQSRAHRLIRKYDADFET